MSAAGASAAPVYARALMEASGSEAPKVLADLDALLGAIAESPAEWQRLLAPQVSATAQKAVLDSLLAAGSPLTRNLLRVLVDKRRIAELAEVTAAFRELVLEQQRQLDVQITTAIEMPDDLRRALEERLSSSTGKTVRLHASVDPAIIGGLVVQHGDSLVDTSLRSRLEQLRLQLSRPSSSSNKPHA